MIGEEEGDVSTRDSLKGLARLHTDGGVEGLPGGFGGIEVEFVDQAEGMFAKHLKSDAAGGFPAQPRDAGREADKGRPQGFKLGFVFGRINKDDEFVHGAYYTGLC